MDGIHCTYLMAKVQGAAQGCVVGAVVAGAGRSFASSARHWAASSGWLVISQPLANAETTADRLRAAGFEQMETNVEYMPAVMDSAGAYREFLTNVIFGTHLARIPEPALRERYVDTLTDLAATDDTPYELDYWRLNMRARRPA